jgi:hypothetical protein
MDDNINKYYSFVDKEYLNNVCKNNNLKNLVKLSTINDLYIFNKKNKRWYLKSKFKLLNECNNIKKKELKSSSSIFSNLAKLNTFNCDINNICSNIQNKINNIDNMIKCIEELKTDSELDNMDNFIECYSNC